MSLLDLIFPKSCLECKAPGKYICNNCLSKVKTLNIFNSKTQIFSIFKYEGIIRKAIIKIKYNFAYDIASELADACVSHIYKPSFMNHKSIIIVPIPLHSSRYRWRGFNQSEILAKLIAKKLGWNLGNDLLIRPLRGKNQVGLRGWQRARNMCGKFAVNNRLVQGILNKEKTTLIIFDDVATTGSTIKEAIRVLKTNGGFTKIFGLTIAR